MADWVFDGDRSRDLTDELSFEDSPSFYANSIFSETAVDKMDEIKVILWTSCEGEYGGSDLKNIINPVSGLVSSFRGFSRLSSRPSTMPVLNFSPILSP